MGTTFASTAIVNPRLTAAILGTWIKGLGVSKRRVGNRLRALRFAAVADRGDAPHGNPRGHAREVRLCASGWRRQRPSSSRFSALNSARLYNLDLRANYGRLSEDKFAQIKRDYDAAGKLTALRDNTAYGYIAKA